MRLHFFNSAVIANSKMDYCAKPFRATFSTNQKSIQDQSPLAPCVFLYACPFYILLSNLIGSLNFYANCEFLFVCCLFAYTGDNNNLFLIKISEVKDQD